MKVFWRVLLVVAACAFAWFLWPTPYIYMTQRRDGYDRIVRVNRVTGAVESFIRGMWEKL